MSVASVAAGEKWNVNVAIFICYKHIFPPLVTAGRKKKDVEGERVYTERRRERERERVRDREMEMEK